MEGGAKKHLIFRADFWEGDSLQSEFCTKDFFWATNYLTKNAPKFPPKFLSLHSVGQKKSRNIPAKIPTKFPKFHQKNSPTSFCRSAGRRFWGRGCDEALFSEKRGFQWNRGEAIQWIRGLVRISTGNAIQWRGSGHSLNRRTLKTEKLLSSSPSRKSALMHVALLSEIIQERLPLKSQIALQVTWRLYQNPSLGQKTLQK